MHDGRCTDVSGMDSLQSQVHQVHISKVVVCASEADKRHLGQLLNMILPEPATILAEPQQPCSESQIPPCFACNKSRCDKLF